MPMDPTSPAAYEGKFTVQPNVYKEASCHAAANDEIVIVNQAGQFSVSTSNKTHETFWKAAILAYDIRYGVLLGSSGKSTISIALGRETQNRPFNIHVYVKNPDSGRPQPDDGSWTGSGHA